jgi:hypothetical protein
MGRQQLSCGTGGQLAASRRPRARLTLAHAPRVQLAVACHERRVAGRHRHLRTNAAAYERGGIRMRRRTEAVRTKAVRMYAHGRTSLRAYVHPPEARFTLAP